MNIAFVYDNTSNNLSPISSWRGIMYYEAIKKMGFHDVDLIASKDFNNNDKSTQKICEKKQLLIIEGSSNIDLLQTVNYWKSHDKTVIIDIPLSMDNRFNHSQVTKESDFRSKNQFSISTKNTSSEIDNSESFEWGVHLADAVLLSSSLQQEYWQTTAPLYVIPEYIDIDKLHDLARIKHDETVIGIICDYEDFVSSPLPELISSFSKTHKQIKWFPIFPNKSDFPDIFPKKQSITFPGGIKIQWPKFVSVIDIAIIYTHRSKTYRNTRIPLELMSMKIPWISNEVKAFQNFSRYGLIVNAENQWDNLLSDMISNYSIFESSIVEEGYLFSISYNIDDHIHEVLSIFSEIMRNHTQ